MKKDMKLAACIFCDHWDDKKERMKNKLYCKASCKYRQKYEKFKARIKQAEYVDSDYVDVSETNVGDTISRQAVELRITEFFTNETYTEGMLRNDIHNLPSAQQKKLKYSGESICNYCITNDCAGCVYEPIEKGDE